MGHWGIGALGHLGIGALGIGALGIGALGHWDIGTLGSIEQDLSACLKKCAADCALHS